MRNRYHVFFFVIEKYYDLRFASLIELETALWLLMISVARVGMWDELGASGGNFGGYRYDVWRAA